MEWVFVNKNRPKEMNELRRAYHYSPHDLKEILPPLQWPKVVQREGYVFLILLFPLFDRTTRDIRASEVDFFISPDRLVTVNVDGLAPLSRLFRDCEQSGSRSACINGGVGLLLRSLLTELTLSVFPMLVHISNDLDDIEKRLFGVDQKNLIRELLRVKTNIAAIRKAVQSHKAVIEHLLRIAPSYFPHETIREWNDELISRMKDIWQTLEIEKETADALHETHQSLIDNRSNEIIKTLTIFSVIVFPLTLMAAIFGMNVPDMPIVSSKNGFWSIISLMLMGTGGMLVYFKWRKWL